MLKNVFVAAALAVGFAFISVPASAAYVYVTTAPPAAMVEKVPVSPGRGYAWMPGHYRWTGSSYVWVRGHYVRHAGAYCNGHWLHSPGHGYYWVDGRWC